ncbi:hypothetical protein M419DRAFT_11025 [Trichoderma reesei RUT C-30]|uniref:Core Histone H2A/H2B/H3 domain-containing protein n=1 Tax=Hypocrea jecorina (strain ATCC 56765 / BCRC 32924 / NRRL 11460 / Rut C-30) TaxID=1344414 RepID=A0A024S2I1_HYPJR|nr:hypothetical protein M419DRAFT_11025 [Trichoderma reesei RUT C-30]
MAERRAEWLFVHGKRDGKSRQPATPRHFKRRFLTAGDRRWWIKRIKKILVIRRKLFWRLCNEVLFDLGFTKLRVSPEASDVIQEACEGSIALYFEVLNQYAHNAGRVTVFRKDLRLFKARMQNPSSRAPMSDSTCHQGV